MSIKTVNVRNLSLGASEQELREFFNFSGDIEFIEMQSDNERCQAAFVTFKDPQGAETAVLLSGATIVDMPVVIALASDYKLPVTASQLPVEMEIKNAGASDSAVQKAEDVVSGMISKGFVLGKDAINKAKAFDEKHRLSSTTSAKVASLDQKIGLSEKITMVNEKVKEMDEKFQVSEKTKSAFVAANQAGSAIMKNRYVMTGTSWVTGAFGRVSKKEEKEVGEEGYAQIQEESESSKEDTKKPLPAQGLIL